MNHQQEIIGRRTVLKGTGVTLAGLAGLASPAAAAKGKRTSLVDGPAEYQLFWSTGDDPSTLGEFGYPVDQTETPDPSDPSTPNGAFIAGEDGKGGLFDGSEIEMTPNGKTLHHTLRFFNGYIIERNQGKPYTLKNRGVDQTTDLYRFSAHNQEMTFRAVSQDDLSKTPIGRGANYPPFSILAGEKWRALGREVLFLKPDPNGDPSPISLGSATRIDFFGLSAGSPEYELSLLYIIYPNAGAANPNDPDFQSIPDVPYESGKSFITDGRRHLGGQ